MKSTICIVCSVVGFLVFVGGCQGGARVEFLQGEDKIDVVIDGKHFTSYLYTDKLTKPVLYPVRTPSGIVVNRTYPLGELAGESADHPHHVGVYFTYDEVNNQRFWANTDTAKLPQIKHIKVTEMKGGRGNGTLSTMMDWVGGDGNVLLEETRSMVFGAGEDEYFIDFSIKLTAQDTKVTFGDTKEGMFSIRTADWLREDKGSGKYLSSNGDVSPVNKNIWGKRARWVRLEGEMDGKPVGIVIFNHPESVNYPTYWHARPYGLFAANPLGQGFFEKKRKQENPQPFGLVLEPGESALFKFRMIVYEGARSKEQLERKFAEFAQ